jgi:hypothetical protein
MGTFRYGSPGVAVEFDDRALMHLQIVITTKLRRKEGFVFTWPDAGTVGNGRNSVWMDPSIPIFYRYFGSRTPSINKEWVATLMASANSGSGLYFIAESTKPKE